MTLSKSESIAASFNDQSSRSFRPIAGLQKTSRLERTDIIPQFHKHVPLTTIYKKTQQSLGKTRYSLQPIQFLLQYWLSRSFKIN